MNQRTKQQAKNRPPASQELDPLKELYEREWFVMLLIFAFSLLIKVVYLFFLRNSPTFDSLMLDAFTHFNWAEQLVNNRFSDPHEFFRAPVYPYFLAIMLALIGKNFFLLHLVQFIIGSLSNVLVYKIAGRLFDKPTALLASFLCACSWILIYFEGEFLIPVLYIFWILLLFFFLTRPQPCSLKNLACASVTFVLALYTRPNILLFLPLFLLWIGYQSRTIERIEWASTFRRIGVVCVVIGIGMSLFAIRNRVMTGTTAWLPSQGGINFHIGNSLAANGREAVSFPGHDSTAPPEELRDHPFFLDSVWLSYTRQAFEETGRILNQSEVSSHWLRKALSDIQQDPARWIGLMFRKTYYFLNATEIPSNQPLIAYWNHYSGPLKFLQFNAFGVLLCLFVVDILINRRNWKRYLLVYAFMAAYAVSVILFFVTARFRIPLLPFLIMFASHAAIFLFVKGKSLKTNQVLLYVVIAVVILPLSYSKRFEIDNTQESHFHFNLGAVHLGNQDLPSAVREFELAVEEFPYHVQYLNTLGHTLIKLGRAEEARPFVERSLKQNPESADAFYCLGLIAYVQGSIPQALSHFETVDRIDPIYNADFFRFRYGDVLERNGDVDEAERQYAMVFKLLSGRKLDSLDTNREDAAVLKRFAYMFVEADLYGQAASFYLRVLQLWPDYPEVHYDIGLTMDRQGRLKEAIEHYQSAVQLLPDYFDAHVNLGAALFNTGQLDQSIEHFRKAVSLQPNSQLAIDNLASAIQHRAERSVTFDP